MKWLGLIGGMSWESTVPYYQHINRTVRDRLGGLHSARILLASVDFAEIEPLQRAGRWDDAGRALATVADTLQQAGAELIVLCTNTMHIVAPALEAALRVPLLHIVDPTARALRAAGVHTVALLGTRFTMEQAFYRDRLAAHGFTVLTPAADDRAQVHRVIYDELCRGAVHASSRATYVEVIGRLQARGAQAVILGCTEITLLIGADDSPLPVFDTTALHAQAAALAALD